MNTTSTTASSASSARVAEGASFAVVVLTAMNLLNYIDRYAPTAVKPLLIEELHLTDEQSSWQLSAFIVVYMLTSPLFGTLADRMTRKRLVGIGVIIWSLATASAALAHSFPTFLFARAMVGVGEAAYATIAPSIIADFFPPEKRNKIFTIFYIAIPVGSALGFTLGGMFGEAFGWRAAFLMVGLPGLLVALLAFFMREPTRGAMDGDVVIATPPPWREALPSLVRNKSYMFTIAGYTAVTFATGGIADWFATFLHRDRGMSLTEAGGSLGIATVVGGIAGTALGGVIADRLKGVVRQPYLAVSALAMIPAVVLCVLAIYVVKTPSAILVLVTLAQVFLWAYNAPVNALIVNSVDASLRARAFGLSILSIHLLGDVLSPPLIGRVNDSVHDLPLSLAMVPAAVVVASLIWLVGWRTLPERG